VQIQRSSLKLGERPNRYFDPGALQHVERLSVAQEGALGVLADGTHILDLHNTTHPHTHNNSGSPLSVGFTAHYQAMRDRFGEHVADGVAGENIIVTTDRAYGLDDLGERVGFQNPQTGQIVYLKVVKIVAPCNEFSQFCYQKGRHDGEPLSGAPLKETLQFLGEGRRGIVLTVENGVRFEIASGDIMLIDDQVWAAR
jgi:hypothetical protein